MKGIHWRFPCTIKNFIIYRLSNIPYDLRINVLLWLREAQLFCLSSFGSFRFSVHYGFLSKYFHRGDIYGRRETCRIVEILLVKIVLWIMVVDELWLVNLIEEMNVFMR